MTSTTCIDYSLIRKAEIEAEKNGLRKQINDLDCQLNEAKTDIKALRDLNRRKAEQIEGLTAKLAASEKRFDDSLSEDYAKLNAVAKAKQELIDGLRKRLKGTNRLLKMAAEWQDHQAVKRDELEGTLQKKSDKILKLQRDAKRKQTFIDKQRRALEKLNAELRSIFEEVKELRKLSKAADASKK